MKNDAEAMKAGLLLLQSARREFASSKTYERSLEVQIAEADYDRLAQANRREMAVVWVNPNEPLPSLIEPARNWLLYTGKKPLDSVNLVV